MAPPNRPAWVRYAAAAAFAGTAWLLTALLIDAIGGRVFLFFFPAVLLAAWWGGFGPGLLASALSVGIIGWRFLPPPGMWAIDARGDALSLVVFAASAYLIASLVDREHRSRVVAEERATESERLRRQLDVILDGIADGVTAHDATGHLVFANTAAARATGYASPAEMLAAPPGELLRKFELLDQSGQPFPLEELPGRRAARGEENTEALIHYRNRETGATHWSMVRARALRDTAGEGTLVINIFRDLTAMIEQQQLVEQQATELEQQVEELQAMQEELEQANEEAAHALAVAEHANRSKSEFLATMSHELRTPLNAIAGYAELMELGVYGPVVEQQREALQRVRRSQGHLLALINDVLNFAKLEASEIQLHIRDIEVDAVLGALDPLIGPQIAAKRLQVTRSVERPGLLVRADRDKLEQILLNLLSNAIKFTPEAGRIMVTAAPANGDGVHITVRDTGIGIPHDKLSDIFEPFVQLEPGLTRTHGGTGLGLAISRDLARRMGGDVYVESTLGEGAAFTIVLPGGGAARAPRAGISTESGRHERA